MKISQLPPGFSLSDYAGVIVAASVHAGKHSAEVISFARANLGSLYAVPSTFISVSLSQAGAEDSTAPAKKRAAAASEARRMVQGFLMDSGWRPSIAKPVAGALRYTQYNWLMKWIMKRIARKSGGATDTSRDWVYTDWAGLDRFAREFTSLVAARKSGADSRPAWSESVLR